MKMYEVILKKRKALNMTQEQMAEYLGVTAPAVHKWEKGSSIPDVTVLPALARLLKIDLNTLFSFYQMAVTRKDEGRIAEFGRKMLDSMDEEYCLQKE